MAIATYLGRKSSKPKPHTLLTRPTNNFSEVLAHPGGPLRTLLPLGRLPRGWAGTFGWHLSVKVVRHQEPFSEQGEGDPEAFPHAELRFADAPVVGNRDLRDRDSLPRTPCEDVRFDVEPVRRQAEGLELLGVEGPHSAADVGDGGLEEERCDCAEDTVSQVVRAGHGAFLNRTENPRSDDDGLALGEFLHESGNNLRRIRSVAIEEHGVLFHDPRKEFTKCRAFPFSALNEDLGAELLRDRAGAIRRITVQQGDFRDDAGFPHRPLRNAIDDGRDAILFVEGRQHNREADARGEPRLHIDSRHRRSAPVARGLRRSKFASPRTSSPRTSSCVWHATHVRLVGTSPPTSSFLRRMPPFFDPRKLR